jgi:hypothetical protein
METTDGVEVEKVNAATIDVALELLLALTAYAGKLTEAIGEYRKNPSDDALKVQLSALAAEHYAERDRVQAQLDAE